MEQKTVYKCPYCDFKTEVADELMFHLHKKHNIEMKNAFEYATNVKHIDDGEGEDIVAEEENNVVEKEERSFCTTVFSGRLCEGDDVMVFLTHIKTPIRGTIVAIDRSGITLATGYGRDMISFKAIRHVRVLGDDNE